MKIKRRMSVLLVFLFIFLEKLNNMILRIEPLKGMDRFNPSKQKEYRNSKNFIKTIEKYIKEASSNKTGYIQQLHKLKKHLKQETLRDFEQIRRKSKEEIAILPHSTHNGSMSLVLPPKTER